MTLIGKIILSISQLFAFFVMGALFVITIPWPSAISVADAELRYNRKFPVEWHGVHASHGQFYDSPLGVASDHQFLYYTLVCAMIVCWLHIVLMLFIVYPQLNKKIRLVSIFHS